MIRSATISFIGLVGLASCWYGISGQANYNNQLPWLVGAVGSLVVGAFGIVGWLLAGIREVHREMHDVMTEIRTDRLGETLSVPADSFTAEYSASPFETAEPVQVESRVYLTNASMTRVHRPGCQHVQGRIVNEINEAEIASRGLSYCGVCCT